MARSRPEGSGNILQRPASGQSRARGGLFKFVGEVISELKKVTWPTREEATRLTLLVLAVSVSVGTALWIIDSIFTQLFEQFIF